MAKNPSNNGHTETFDEVDHLAQLSMLLPGDVVELWDAGSFIAKTIFLCQEVVEGRTASWRWTFLNDGSLIETSPDGYFWYCEHRLCKQGTDLYEELVAQDGALVRFEERVRSGVSGRRPVRVTIEGRDYRIASTGTVSVQRLGDDVDLIPWASLSKKADDNVYFGLVDAADESKIGLGLWTVHLALSFGRELTSTDVTEVYLKNENK